MSNINSIEDLFNVKLEKVTHIEVSDSLFMLFRHSDIYQKIIEDNTLIRINSTEAFMRSQFMRAAFVYFVGSREYEIVEQSNYQTGSYFIARKIKSNSVDGVGVSNASFASSIPLRYRIVDKIYFKIKAIPFVKKLLIWIFVR